jgi:hypothetical protein
MSGDASMKTTISILALGLGFAMTGLVSAARADDKAAAQGNIRAHVCESGEDKRVVEIRDRAGGGCTVVYTRDGKPKDVGGAAHSTEVCDQILEKIIKNLETAKYQCS